MKDAQREFRYFMIDGMMKYIWVRERFGFLKSFFYFKIFNNIAKFPPSMHTFILKSH